MSGGRGATSKTQGTNHYGGVAINFFIKEQKEENPVSMSIYESNGKHIKTFSTKPNKEKKEGKLDLSNGNNIFFGCNPNRIDNETIRERCIKFEIFKFF